MMYNLKNMRNNQLPINAGLSQGRLYPGETERGMETFMGLDVVGQMVMAAMSGRIDGDGCVKPEVVRLCSRNTNTEERPTDRPMRFEQAGKLLPSDNPYDYEDEFGEYRARTSYYIDGWIYSSLTGGESINIDPDACDKLDTEHDALVRTVRDKGYEIERSYAQLSDAFHIHNPNAREPDFTSIRFYIHAGTAGAKVADDILQGDGVDIAYAKVWAPQQMVDAQRFRKDTPIIGVDTYSQLESVVNRLRELKDQGRLPADESTSLRPGYVINDLPGVYVGQSGGGSFNRNMTNLLSGPIERACRENNLYNGEKVTGEWLDKVAAATRNYMLENAISMGISPEHHAFLANQPVDGIIRTIELH